jgi:hypothetical protein
MNAMTHIRSFSVAAIVLATTVIGGCAATTRHIADIKQYPARYEQRTVTIKGRVTQSFGASMSPVTYYKVNDGTGEMTVFANGPAPPTGSMVKVEGRVSQVAAFGSRSFGLHLQQEHVNVHLY